MPKSITKPTVTLLGALILTAGVAVPAHAADASFRSTNVVTQSVEETIVPFGSSGWSYWYSSQSPQRDWKTTDGVAWPTAEAPLARGIGLGHVGTKIDQFSGRQPLATYVRTEVAVAELPQSAQITTWADDGIVAYVNGREVGRHNIRAGKITPNTYAIDAPQTKSARNNPVTFDVPGHYWQTGTNVVAFQIASNWRATHNISFDAEITRTDVVEVTPEPEPVLPQPEPAPGDDAAPVDPPTDSESDADETPAVDSAVLPGWGAPAWRDEFTYTDPSTGEKAVDPTKWNVRDRSDLGLLFDAAVPDKNQVTVDDSGVAHIRADWYDEPVKRPSNQSGPTDLWHKTGYMDHRVLHEGNASYAQAYGRWEIRAKVPTGPKTLGSLAAFWLRNSQSGEIDIMEAWGYDEKGVRDQRINTATTTVHTHTANPSANTKYIWHHADYGGPANVWKDFHTYAFELTPEYAAIIVDDVELTRVTPKTHPNLWDPRYFGTPLHVRLNLHVGPSAQYWGLPDPNNRQATQNLDFEVDYVRIWAYEPDRAD